jgi:hypothetical protein
MATEQLSRISESPAPRTALPGWIWTGSITAAPAEPDRSVAGLPSTRAVDVRGIVAGLGALLDAMAATAPDA